MCLLEYHIANIPSGISLISGYLFLMLIQVLRFSPAVVAGCVDVRSLVGLVIKSSVSVKIEASTICCINGLDYAKANPQRTSILFFAVALLTLLRYFKAELQTLNSGAVTNPFILLSTHK